MWAALIGWIKSLFGGKGAMQIGKGNQATTASSTGDNSPVITAGRDVHFTMHGNGSAAPKNQRDEILDWIHKNGPKEPPSQVLPQVLRLARIVGNHDIERWARLELIGYTHDGGMRKEEVVPEYRTVTGQYYDDYDRPLRVPAKLHFVNQYRFRYGVATLEEFAKKTEMQNIADPDMLELILTEFKVRVSRFCFSPLAVADVVHSIRNLMLDKVHTLEMETKTE